MKTFSEQEIIDTFRQHVAKPAAYFTRCTSQIALLTPEEKQQWLGKDVPRLFSLFEFRDWIRAHGIERGRRLFYTSPTDPELLYLSYERADLFEYAASKNNDLHTLQVAEPGYDLAIFNQTLEHLYNPFLSVERLFNVLRPGGYLYTTVPTINMPHMVPFHFWGITPIGLCMLMKSAGFEVCECGYWGNKRYMEQLFSHKHWPDFTQVCEPDGTIENDFHCQSQTWILVRKPVTAAPSPPASGAAQKPVDPWWTSTPG